MARHTLRVEGKDCEVMTYQRTKSVWIATGTDLLGDPLQQQGRTETAALKHWGDVAGSRYRCS